VQIDRTFRRAGAIEGRTGCRSIERSCGEEERELQAGKIEDEDENEDEEENLSMDPIKTQIVVVGAGPGGYAAAFYAADLGMKVILVEREKRLGGVCLNCGCIPSKALLYATHQITAARDSEHRGITFAPPTVDLPKLRAWKESILEKLAGGVSFLAQKRGVQVIKGKGYFEDSQTLRVETEQGQQFIQFEKAILA